MSTRAADAESLPPNPSTRKLLVACGTAVIAGAIGWLAPMLAGHVPDAWAPSWDIALPVGRVLAIGVAIIAGFVAVHAFRQDAGYRDAVRPETLLARWTITPIEWRRWVEDEARREAHRSSWANAPGLRLGLALVLVASIVGVLSFAALEYRIGAGVVAIIAALGLVGYVPRSLDHQMARRPTVWVGEGWVALDDVVTIHGAAGLEFRRVHVVREERALVVETRAPDGDGGTFSREVRLVVPESKLDEAARLCARILRPA